LSLRRPLPPSFVLAALCVVAHPAHAADSLAVSHDPPPRREWRRVDAWGVTRQAALMRDLPASLGVIAADLITDLGARDLAEVSRALAGSPPDPSEPESGAWTVRGFAPSSLSPTLTNGARHAYGHGPIDPVSVDHLERLQGVLDPVYGAVGSPGGSLHRVGRSPTLEPLRAMTLGADANGRLRGTLDVSDVLGTSRATYRVTGALDRLRDFRSLDEAGTGAALSPVLSWPMRENMNLTLRANHAQRTRRDDPGLPLPAVALTLPRDAWYGDRHGASVRTAASDATLEFTYDPEGEVRLRQRLSFDRTTRRGADTQLFGTTTDGAVLRRRRDLDRRTQGFDAQSEAVIAFLTGGRQHQGVVGVEIAGARLEREASATLFDVVPITGTPTSDSTIGHGAAGAWRGDDRAFALYVNDQVPLGPRLRASFGARLGRDEHVLAPAPGALATTSRATGISPRVGLAVLTSATTRLHAAWSTGVRANPRCEACGDAPAPEAARSRQIELGWRQELRNGRFGWTATAYEVVDRDAVVREADPERAATWLPRRTSRGVELQANGEIRTDLRVVLSAAWTDARVTEAGTSGWRDGARLPRVPFHAITAMAIQRVSEGAFAGLDLGLGVEYEGERPADPSGTLMLPAATLTSAMLGYGRDRWHVQVNATNLGDVRAFDADPSGALWPREPRAVRGTLRWAF
jgi:catecholate siderophore receptor